MTSPLSKLIEPDALALVLDNDDLVIIDLCHPALYQQHHVPGAVHLAGQKIMSEQTPAAGKCPAFDDLKILLTSLGITRKKRIVIYDDEGGGWAGRFAWILDLMGVDNWCYLNGGIIPWIKEGFPTESGNNPPKSIDSDIGSDFSNLSRKISADQIITKLGEKNFAIWDARSPAEYTGEMVRANRGGHIPGAINLEWTNLMDQHNHLRIRSNAQDILDRVGLTIDKTIATHCQLHHRSGFTYMVARILGYKNIAGYDGSWAEWGNMEDTPIKLGPEKVYNAN